MSCVAAASPSDVVAQSLSFKGASLQVYPQSCLQLGSHRYAFLCSNWDKQCRPLADACNGHETWKSCWQVVNQTSSQRYMSSVFSLATPGVIQTSR